MAFMPPRRTDTIWCTAPGAPLISADEAAAAIDMAEGHAIAAARAARASAADDCDEGEAEGGDAFDTEDNGAAAAGGDDGWTTSRHYSVPTTDIPVHAVPPLLEWFNGALRSRIFPAIGAQLARAFFAGQGGSSGESGESGGGGAVVAAAAVSAIAASSYGFAEGCQPITEAALGAAVTARLRVHDAFVVKYCAATGQRHLPVHVDQSHLSFTLALNGHADPMHTDPDEVFVGGGTFFEALGSVCCPEAGGMTVFPGRLLHGGEGISAGTRYIVAGFLYISRDTDDAELLPARGLWREDEPRCGVAATPPLPPPTAPLVPEAGGAAMSDAAASAVLRAALAQDATAGTKEGAEAGEEQQPLQLFPSVEGTALFSLLCSMNHSCSPNIVVRYDGNSGGADAAAAGASGTASAIARRAIAAGDELCISYIDETATWSERAAALDNYGFRCECERCMHWLEQELVDGEGEGCDEEAGERFGEMPEYLLQAMGAQAAGGGGGGEESSEEEQLD